MSDYMKLVAEVAAVHRDDIGGDLDHARHRLRLAHGEAAELERQISALEALLELRADDRNPPEVATMTLHEAMAEVLRTTHEHMLRAGDLAAEVDRRGLYKMRDGRPVEAQQIHARVGHYQHLFTKVGTFITLAESPAAPE